MLLEMNPIAILGLFIFSTLLGAIGRHWTLPSDLICHLGPFLSAWVAPITTLAANKLSAATLLSSHLPKHLINLLIGLDLGPNLGVLEPLSAILRLRIAKSNKATPSIAAYSKVE